MLAYTPIAMMSSPWIPRVQVKHFTLTFPEEILHSYLVHHPTLTSHLGMPREPRESRAKPQIFRRKELLRSWSKPPRATKLRQLQKRPPELGYCLEFPFVFFLQNRKLHAVAFTTSCVLRRGSPCICEQNYESTVRSGSHKSSCKIIQWQGEEEVGGGWAEFWLLIPRLCVILLTSATFAWQLEILGLSAYKSIAISHLTT